MSKRWGGVIGVLLLSFLSSASSAEGTWWLLNLKKTPGTLDWVPPGTYVLHVETVEPAAVHETTIKVGLGRDTNVGAIQLASDLQTDEHHCGACNNQCAAGQTCQAGTCATPECAPGFGDCDGIAANGCEASLTTDANCGACGVVCAPGSNCRAGVCG